MFRKIFRYTIPILAISLLVVFLFLGWMEARLESVSRQAFGATLSYGTASWENDAIVLSNVVLDREGRSDDIDLHIQFDKVKIKPDIAIKERNIAFNLEFTHPNILVNKHQNEELPWKIAQERLLKSISQFKWTSTSLFRVSVNAYMGGGEVELVSEDKHVLMETAPVHLIYQGWEVKENSSHSIQKGINIFLEKKNEAVEKSVVLSEVNCSNIVQLAEFFSGPIFYPWKWEEGVLEGYFSLSEEENSPYLNGEGIIRNARIDHTTSGMGTYFKEMKLLLSRRTQDQILTATNGFEEVRNNTKCQMLLTQPAAFFRHLDRASQWILKDIMGNIVLGDELSPETIHWNFEGSLTVYDEEPDAKFEINGSLPLNFKEGQEGKILVKRDVQGDEAVSTHFHIKALENDKKQIDLTVANWGPHELDVVQHLWPNRHIFDDSFRLHEGKISAKINLQEDNTVHVSGVSGTDLVFSLNHSEIQGTLEKLTGDCDFVIDESLVTLDECRVKFCGGSIERARASLEDFSGSLNLSKGILQKANLIGKIAGLVSEINFHGFSEETIATASLQGNFRDFVQLLPEKWSERIDCAKDQLKCNAVMKKSGQELCVNSQIELCEDTGHKFQLNGEFFVECPQMLLRNMKFLKGSLHTEAFPMERYLSPLLFPEKNTQLSGMTKLDAMFDKSTCLSEFTIADMILDHAYYNIHIGKLASPALFYFDWEIDAFYGNIPVIDASLFEKRHSLLFTDIQTQINIENGEIHLTEMKAISEKMNFEGNISLNLSEDHQSTMFIETERVEGTTEALLNFSSHFSENDFWKKPFQGMFSSGPREFFLHAIIPTNPEETSQVDWKLKGNIRDASYSFASNNIHLNNLSLDFDFDSSSDRLFFSQVNAEMKEYQLKADYIAFDTFSAPNILFDVGLYEGLEEYARFLGGSRKVSADHNQIYLNQELTHVGHIYPEINSLLIKNWEEVEFISAKPKANLKTICKDLAVLSKAFNHYIPFEAIPFQNQLEGTISASVETIDSEVKIELTGHDVAFKDHRIDSVCMQGLISNGVCYLQDGQFGKIKMFGELSKIVGGINGQLVAFYGSDFSLNIDGNYSSESNTCHLSVNDCQLDLRQISNIGGWKQLLEPWQVQGIAKCSGTVDLTVDKETGHQEISGQLRTSISDLIVRGMPINNMDLVDLSFSSQEGFKIEGINLKLQRADQSYYHANLALKSAKYEAEGDNLSVEGLDFALSTPCVAQLTEIGQDLLPELFDETTSAFLQNFQCQDGLSGSLHMRLSPANINVRLQLKDGQYQVWGKEYDLHHIVMDFDKEKIRLIAQYKFYKTPLNIALELDRASMRFGKATIRDQTKQTKPLVIHWEGDVKEGVIIKKIEGSIAGLEVNLLRGLDLYNTSHMVFHGYLRLHDGLQLAAFLPTEASSLISNLELIKGYEVQGQFVIPENQWKEMHFQGSLFGKNCSMFGCQIDAVKASLLWTPAYLLVHNFTINDQAGKLAIEEMSFGCDAQDKWSFFIPKIDISEFKPSLLKRGEDSGKKLKKLVIDVAHLSNLRGYISDPRSYTGSGTFDFENLPKKNFLEKTLLLLPAEIIGRIGLSANIWEPAMGTVVFSLKNGKLYFDKLQDVYSEGKRSKFYLPKDDKNSYVDFDGNLHLNIRTKQYNLLFKLAELGQVSVRGNIAKPSYSFHKRPQESS